MSTPTPTHTAVPHVQATAPERIYLVIGEDVEPDTDFDDLGRGMDSDGVTWCADKIDDNSIPYVRADLASLPAPQGEQPLDPNESDPGVLWAEICRLRAAVAGPLGYATWQQAATAEKVRRVKAERELAAALGANQDSRTPTVAPGGLPLPQADPKDGFGDSVSASVEPSGATLSPCAASTAITPAIAARVRERARVFALREPERCAELVREAIDKATPQVDRGESSSEGEPA